MRLSQLRDQLADLKKKETIAQTKEQLLIEEKQKLLDYVEELYTLVRKLNIVPEEDLTPSNLVTVSAKLQSYIESEISKSNIPIELQ
jgi:leucyl aminopeptidase